MLKSISKLEFKIGEKNYVAYCDNDSPLSHVKEFAFQILKCIGQLEDDARKREEESKPQVAETENIENVDKKEVIEVQDAEQIVETSS